MSSLRILLPGSGLEWVSYYVFGGLHIEERVLLSGCVLNSVIVAAVAVSIEMCSRRGYEPVFGCDAESAVIQHFLHKETPDRKCCVGALSQGHAFEVYLSVFRTYPDTGSDTGGVAYEPAVGFVVCRTGLAVTGPSMPKRQRILAPEPSFTTPSMRFTIR